MFVTSGTEDFLLHLAVPGTDSLYAFVVDRLTTRPEVSDVRTSVVYEHLRSNVLPPARGRGGRRLTPVVSAADGAWPGR